MGPSRPRLLQLLVLVAVCQVPAAQVPVVPREPGGAGPVAQVPVRTALDTQVPAQATWPPPPQPAGPGAAPLPLRAALGPASGGPPPLPEQVGGAAPGGAPPAGGAPPPPPPPPPPAGGAPAAPAPGGAPSLPEPAAPPPLLDPSAQSRNPGAGVLGGAPPPDPPDLGAAAPPPPPPAPLPPAGGPPPGGAAGAAPAAGFPGAVAATGFDCNAGGPWSENQKAWCCSNKGLGCASKFDCKTDLANAASWPDEQKKYCCESEGRACDVGGAELLSQQPAAPPAGVLPGAAEPADAMEATPSLPPGYCEDGFDDWQANWSARKKDFCCENEGKGCPPSGGAPEGNSTSAGPPEDTTENSTSENSTSDNSTSPDENSTSENSTSPEENSTPQDDPETTTELTLSSEPADVKQVKHVEVVDKKVDSSAPEPNATAPSDENSTAPEVTAGAAICATNCTLDGKAFPCKDRVLWAAAHAFDGDIEACDSAHRLVVAQCPMCAGCTPLQSGCLDEGAPATPAPPSPGEAAQGVGPECGVSCTFKGESSSCGDRLHWVAKFLFSDEANPCQAAYDVVLKECNDCSSCSAELAGCTDNVSAAKGGGAHGDKSKGGGAKGGKGGGAKGGKAQGDKATMQPGLVGFDCNAGIKKWERGWSDDKKEWCCSHHNKGCVTTVTTTTSTTSTDDGFDCSEGYYNWQRGWSEEKKAWCCEQEKRACPDGDGSKGDVASSTTASTTSHRGVHHRRRMSTTRRAASSTATSTTSRGDVHRLRTSSTPRTAATSTATSTTSPAPYNCDEGYAHRETSWESEKKRWCCDFEAVGCSAANSSSSDADAANASGSVDAEANASGAAPVPALPPALNGSYERPVAKDVQVNSSNATASNATASNASDASNASNASNASSASTATATVTATTTTGQPAPWDCEDSASDPARGWTVSRKAWCCSHAFTGCPDIEDPGSEEAASSTSKPFDCQAGFNNWEAGWSEDKKTWCCDHEDKGCSGTSAPYDCQAGFNNWEAGWSGDKKRWCCAKEGRGCTTTTSPPYDCSAGFKNWEAGWSTNKKAWCCEHEDRACAPEAEELLEQLSADGGPSRLFLEHGGAGRGVGAGRSRRAALGRQAVAALAAAGVAGAAVAFTALAACRYGGRSRHELRAAMPLRTPLSAGEPSGAYAELQAQSDCAEAVSLAE